MADEAARPLAMNLPFALSAIPLAAAALPPDQAPAMMTMTNCLVAAPGPRKAASRYTVLPPLRGV